MRCVARRYRCLALLLGLIAFIWTLPGCGTTSLGSAYLAKDSGSVVFLQCTQDGELLSGSVTTAALAADSETVDSRTYSFTGRVSDSSVNLTFPEGFGAVTSITGTVSGTHLRLSVPAEDGSIAVLDLTPATVSEYNEAVGGLQAQATQATQQKEADAAAVALAADMTAVSDAVSELEGDMEALPGVIEEMKDALAVTYEDEQAVLAEAAAHPDGNNGQVATDAGQVETDAGTVEACYGSLEVAANAVRPDPDGSSWYGSSIESLRSALDQLEADKQALDSATASLVSYAPADAPSEETITQLQDDALAAIQEAEQAVKSYLKQGKQMLAKAQKYAAAAQDAAYRTGG